MVILRVTLQADIEEDGCVNRQTDTAGGALQVAVWHSKATAAS